MPKRTRDYRETLLADLQDPAEASAYLNAALEDSNEMFLVALRDVAEAGQMARVAADAGVAREALYRMLRSTGNPTYASLKGILNAVGLRILIAPASGQQTGKPCTPSPQYQNSMGGLGPVAHQELARRKGPAGELASSIGSLPTNALYSGMQTQLAGNLI